MGLSFSDIELKYPYLRYTFSDKNMRLIPSFGFILVISVFANAGAKASDTLLIDLITLPYNINTIANDSAGTIWLTGARGLQYYDFEERVFVTTDPSIKDHIYTDQGRVVRYIRSEEELSYPWNNYDSWLPHLPPGFTRVSAAKDKFGHHWVATGTHLFIFSMEEHFQQILPNYSTRGICQNGEDLYVQTYSGIIKNGRLMFEQPYFGLGEVKKFGESLYFAWGGLFRYNLSTQTPEHFMFGRARTLEGGNYLLSPKPLEVQNLHQVQDTIWLGTNFGLGYIENDSVVMVSNYPDVQDVIPFRGGLMIAGSQLLKPLKFPMPHHQLSEPDCED